MKTTLYQKTRTGKTQQWSIWVENNGASGYPEVWIEHGHVDGKKQLTHDIIKKGVNVGKINETTPLQQAFLVAERKITKQKEKGYRESKVISKQDIGDFSAPLPKELCFYKPKNSIPDNKIKDLEKNNRAIYTVKRDGMMHVIRLSKFGNGVEIYSRRMDLVTDKYPHLVSELCNLQAGAILLGEIILDKGGKDDFNGVSQICRSDADKAIEKQTELGNVFYYAFDLAFYEEKNLLVTTPYKERLKILNELVRGYRYIKAPEVISGNHKDALAEVSGKGLEGLVVWDSEGVMTEDEAYTFNGKPYRPNLLWKSKPKYEDDFIVRFDPNNGIGEYGTGKNQGKLKSVFLYQINDNGKEIFLAKCGGGLTDDQRSYYTNATYPRVWRVEYDSVQQKTGSLRFPVFSLDRTILGDKDISECLMSDQIKNARKVSDDDSQ